MTTQTFKKGDRVRVVDNGQLEGAQHQFIGKKGIVVGNSPHESPLVLFKSGAEVWYANEKLELVAPKRHSFNLDRALAGDAVVTRDGREVTKLRSDYGDEILASIAGSTEFGYHPDGRRSLKVNSNLDLFMLTKSKPSKSTQIAELTAKVAEQAELIKVAHDFLSELKAITWGSFTKMGIEEMIGRLKG